MHILLALFPYLVSLLTPFVAPEIEYGGPLIPYGYIYILPVLTYLFVIVWMMRCRMSLALPLSKHILIFLLMLTLSLVDSQNKERGLFYLLGWMGYVSIYVLVINGIRNMKELRPVLFSMFVFSALLSCLVIIGSITARGGGPFDFFFGITRLNINKAGFIIEFYFLLLSGLLLLNKGTHKSFWFIWAIMLSGIILSVSRGTLVSAFVGLFSMAIIARKKRVAVTLFLVGIVMPLTFAAIWVIPSLNVRINQLLFPFQYESSVLSRPYLIMVGLEILKGNFFNGVGIGNYPHYFSDAIQNLALYLPPRVETLFESYHTPHNLIVRIAAEAGILGVFSLCYLLIGIFTRVIRFRHRAKGDTFLYAISTGFLCALVANYVHFLFNEALFFYFTWYNYGLIFATLGILEKQKGYLLRVEKEK